MDVRRIRPDEWQLLREFRLRSLLDAPEAFGQSHANAAAEPEAEWQSAARSSASGDRRAWFICREMSAADGREPDGLDVPLGLVQARRRPPADCLVFSMWVAPAARRSGAGRALIDAVRDWSTAWGARRIVLWVFGANSGALHFYERIGFRLLPDGADAESGRAYGALALELPTRSDRA